MRSIVVLHAWLWKTASCVRDFVARHLWCRLLLVYLFFVLMFSFYFFIPKFTSLDDQFFNIRLAQQVSQRGITALSAFDDLAFSDTGAFFYSVLFYYLLIPFTWFHPLELGIKVFAVMGFSFTISTLYLFLSKNGFRLAFLWLLTLLSLSFSVGDYHHFLMARAFILAPGVLVLLLFSLSRRRFFWVGLLSFLYFFLHTATAFLPLILSIVYSALSARHDTRSARKIMMASILGLGSAGIFGFIFLPGFLPMLVNLFTTLFGLIISFQSGLDVVKIDEGMETYPTTLFDIFLARPFFTSMTVIFLTVECARLVRALKRTIDFEDTLKLTLFTMTALLLLASFFTKRAVDFFLIFGLLFIAFSLKEVFTVYTLRDAKMYLSGLIIALVVALSAQILFLADTIASASPYAEIQGATRWIRDNTKENSIVFNPTINFFPTFYFYNAGYNRVIIGLEPRNMYKADARKYWLWYNLSNYGIVCAEQVCGKQRALQDAMLKDHFADWYQETGDGVADIIIHEFGTDIIITSTAFPAFTELLKNNHRFEKVYETPVTSRYSVYRIMETK